MASADAREASESHRGCGCGRARECAVEPTEGRIGAAGTDCSADPSPAGKTAVLLEVLGGEIATGRRAAGSVLTLAGLEGEFGVSRTVVREVVKILQGLGMLRPRPRVGITVQPRECWQVLDPRLIRWRMSEPSGRSAHFLAVNELRRGLEPEAARLAARRGGEADAERLIELAVRMRELGRSGRGAAGEFLAADTAFHELVFAMSGNEIICQLGSTIGSLLVERTHWAMQPDYPDAQAMDSHVRLARAVRRRDEEEAWRAASNIVVQADEEVRAGQATVEPATVEPTPALESGCPAIDARCPSPDAEIPTPDQ